MEEIYIGAKIVAAEPMDERDFAFSKGQAWDEEKANRHGYRVRHAEDNDVDWSEKESFERAHRKMTLKEAEMVASGQFVIPDSSGSTIQVA
jgi:hypothetical protein